MISHLEGTVIHKDLKSIIVDVAGIGYQIFSTAENIDKCNTNEQVSFWTHHAVREDSETLYGFLSIEEKEFFELLITVSGIGPKTALGILNVSTVPSLKRAISTGDTSHLTKVSGIGKKVADKLVLELKSKVEDQNTDNDLNNEVDALEALKSLGYSHKDAREALKQVENKSGNTGDKIKSALKILGK